MDTTSHTALTIVLVEDSADVCDRISEIVSDGGLGVVVACSDNEEDAFAEILRRTPDVVILDIQLRTGNGLNVLRRVREATPASMPAVIVLTDYAIADIGRYALSYGARHFLDKASGYRHLETLLRLLAYSPMRVSG